MGGGTFCVRGIAGIEGLPMEGYASRGLFRCDRSACPIERREDWDYCASKRAIESLSFWLFSTSVRAI